MTHEAGRRTWRLRAAGVAAALVMGVAAVASFAGCGGEDEGFKGTWLRTDDHEFVLTITRPNTADYSLKFESPANGESQTIGALVRPNATLQAAFAIPQEPAGALVAGPPDVVGITLRVEDGLLVVRMDDGRAAESELWRYERAPE